MPTSDSSASHSRQLSHRLASTYPHTMHTADRGHVHVQLHVPLRVSRRDQADRACAASATAQESLRRFAQGYVFGSSSKIGSSTQTSTSSDIPSIQTEITNSEQHFTSTSGPLFDACKGNAFQKTQTQANILSSNDSNDNSSIMPTKFNTTPEFSNRLMNKRSSRSCTTSSQNIERHDIGLESAPKRTRSSLIFGENAPKTSLSIKDRLIGRRTVPKRLREHISVDALSAMVEKLLGKPVRDSKDKVTKRMKASGNDESVFNSFSKVSLTCDNTTKENGKGKNNDESSRSNPSKSNEQSKGISQNGSSVIADDDGTADELSFLVNQCELNPKKQDYKFMPYIT